MVLSNIKVIHLSDLQTGDEGIITKVVGHGAFRKRITEMGFVKGKKVNVSLMIFSAKLKYFANV